MPTKTINIILFLILIMSLIGIFVRHLPPLEIRETTITRDSIIRDTIRDTMSIPYKVTVKGERDTLWQKDTVYVPVYFTQIEYKTDRYKIVIEGYRPKLLSVETYPVTHFITTEKRIETILPPQRITHGLNIGVGAFYGTKGFDMGLYVGYGLTINMSKK